MKTALFIYLLISSLQVSLEPVHFKYCFGFSRTINKESNQQQIFYTDVITTSCSQEDTEALSRKWEQIVDRHCLSKCSSDLNVYNSESEAQGALKKFLNRYPEVSNVQIEKLSFD